MTMTEFDSSTQMTQVCYRKGERMAYFASRVQYINADFLTIYSHGTAITVL